MLTTNGRYPEPADDLDLRELEALDEGKISPYLAEEAERADLFETCSDEESGPALLPRAALGDTPPCPDEIIAGILPASKRGIAGMLVAAEGNLKTFLALAWSCCVATGITWFGRRVKAGPVVYVLGEGQDELLKRIVAW